MSMKQVIYSCINDIITEQQKDYAKLDEIYERVARHLEVENNKTLQSQIRGRLQENCEQYKNFKGKPLFLTKKIRSGYWTIKNSQRTMFTIKNNKRHIRYKNNTYLITDDNWLTVKVVEDVDETYILEKNSDYIYKAKLIQLINSEKANIIINELNIIRNLLKKLENVDKESDGYGTAFEVFAISTIHNIDYEECINKYIIHGDYDGKIDAIYYDNQDIICYQIKIGNIDDNAYDLMQKSYDQCERNIPPENGKDIYHFYLKNKELLKNKNVVFKSISDNSKKDTNYKPVDIYNMFFENKLLPSNENNLTLSILKPELPNSSICQYNVSTDGNNNFIFYIKANELIFFLLEALGINANNYDKDTVDISKYFFDNVRGVLSTNKKMIYTIKNEPENFIKYNNGINITGEVTEYKNKIIIKNPIINNGQQTVTTLMKVNENLDRITVCVKITNEINQIVKGKISQFSNEQVKVKSIDMLSLNPYVRDIQSVIYKNEYNNNKYYLEIYSSGKKNHFEILNKLYKPNNIIKLLDFIKLYFSMENCKDLGAWKNSPNMQIEKIVINVNFNHNKAFKVCESIARFENYITNIKNKKEKDDFKSADLAFKYLICKENLSDDDAYQIIKKINQKYYYNIADKKSKLIDTYKSPTIINKIEEELKIYKNDMQQKI